MWDFEKMIEFGVYLDILTMKMDQETIHYIFEYYFNLLPDKEKLAWKHYSHSIKIGGENNEKRLALYKRHNWLTDDAAILELLKDGIENFELNAAKHLLSKYPDKIFLNLCPKCGKLARTPSAKQCRFCGFDWH